jgi:hypothetical protein
MPGRTDMPDDVKDKIRELLMSLEDDERRLLSRVLKIESDNLHLAKPRVKEDLIKAVKETIK